MQATFFFFSQTRLKPAHSSSFLKRRFPFKPLQSRWFTTTLVEIPEVSIFPLSAVSRLIKHAHYPSVLSNKQCSAHTHTHQRATLIIQCGAWVFFHPHSQGRRDRLKKESMNISLSGNSGSGDCRQEFWLAREDLQNVGSEPRGCLASRAGNLLQTSSSPSYP